MPIEIRELHIKGIVENLSETTTSAQGNNGGEAVNEQLIRACVERVMELIQEARER